MNTFKILMLCLLCSCVTKKDCLTSDYLTLSIKHKKMAILPIIFEGKKMSKDLSETEKNQMMEEENNFVQNAFYQEITLKSGMDNNDVRIKVQPISTTNDILKEKGVDVLHIDKFSDNEVCKVLGVDAVMRIRIVSEVMLHSTKNDLAKNIILNTNIRINNPVLNGLYCVNVASAFLSAEILDTNEMTPIWVYKSKRNLDLLEKNTNMMSNLCGDVMRRFPYRNKDKGLVK